MGTTNRHQQLSRWVDGRELSPGMGDLDDPPGRYLLAERNDCDQWWLTTHDTMDAVITAVNERIAYNPLWEVDCVVDLDTGQYYDVVIRVAAVRPRTNG